MTIRVPTDQPTIAAAIASAPDGYTVLVAPGLYSGMGNRDLNFAGKRLDLRGAADPSSVVIDCEGLARLITFDHAEDNRSGVSGLTVRNCGVDDQGALYMLGAAPTISGNVFDSTMSVSGAQLFGFNGSPNVQKNLFRNTQCDDQHLSGVLAFVNGSSPYIANNVFVGNQCRSVNMSIPEGMTPMVVNNTMVGNRAGIYIDRRVSTASHWYSNNLIVGNERGVEVSFEFSPRSDDLASIFQTNIVFGNATDYLGTTDLTGRSGNLRADPLFVTSPTNLRLAAGSPARGAGAALHAPADDFDGAPRGASFDIGAFQFH
jgi:serine protease